MTLSTVFFVLLFSTLLLRDRYKHFGVHCVSISGPHAF